MTIEKNGKEASPVKWISKAPPPIKPVSGTTTHTWKPFGTIQLPNVDFLPHYLELRTEMVLLVASKAFPNKLQILEFCKETISELTSVFQNEVQSGRLSALSARSLMENIYESSVRLNCLNSEQPSHMQEVEQSEEWEGFIRRLVELEARPADQTAQIAADIPFRLAATFQENALMTTDPTKSGPLTSANLPERNPKPDPSRRLAIIDLVKRLDEELKALKPQMHNESHYEQLQQQNPEYKIFKIGETHPDVKSWVSSVRERPKCMGLAQEVTARHFSLEVSTVKNYWTHRCKWLPKD